VIRSDASEAHRLSLSARFLSVEDGQVKAKRHRKTTEEALLPLAESVLCKSPFAASDERARPVQSSQWVILPGYYLALTLPEVAQYPV